MQYVYKLEVSYKVSFFTDQTHFPQDFIFKTNIYVMKNIISIIIL